LAKENKIEKKQAAIQEKNVIQILLVIKGRKN